MQACFVFLTLGLEDNFLFSLRGIYLKLNASQPWCTNSIYSKVKFIFRYPSRGVAPFSVTGQFYLSPKVIS